MRARVRARVIDVEQGIEGCVDGKCVMDGWMQECVDESMKPKRHESQHRCVCVCV